MTRTLSLIAIGGIAMALVCLPLAATLYHHSGGARSWSWSDHLGWFDDEDDDEANEDAGNEDADHDSHGGQIAARDFAWNGGERLELDVPGNLHFTPGAEWHLSIRASQRVLDRLRVDGGRIAMKHPYRRSAGLLEIELSGPALSDITVNGAGKLALDHLKQGSLAVSIHGSGSVRASGSVESLKLDIMGTGAALLQQLSTRSAKIFIAGSGDADIAPIDDADIFIAGSGDVRLYTHPKHLNSRVAGSGRIIELPGEQST